MQIYHIVTKFCKKGLVDWNLRFVISFSWQNIVNRYIRIFFRISNCKKVGVANRKIWYPKRFCKLSRKPHYNSSISFIHTTMIMTFFIHQKYESMSRRKKKFFAWYEAWLKLYEWVALRWIFVLMMFVHLLYALLVPFESITLWSSSLSKYSRNWNAHAF